VARCAFPDEPSSAAGLDLLPEVLVVLHAGEDHCEVGSDARHGAADGESVVVAEVDVEQHRIGVMALDGPDRSGGAARFGDHVTSARRQAVSCCVPEAFIVVDDDDLRAA
jgi:hypothetical protein